MSSKIGVSETEFLHNESGRPLSSMQLLCLLEVKLNTGNALSSIIKRIGKYRIQADHKILDEEISDKNHMSEFISMCRELSNSLHGFANECRKIEKST